jgi:hypothetical protein
LEESIQVIKPSGSIIMNMGGRPGQAVLERLYERRGFNIRKVCRLNFEVFEECAVSLHWIIIFNRRDCWMLVEGLQRAGVAVGVVVQ